ncbi:MAG: hypothetical protein HOP04_07830 [Methylophilaceae bacterium]|nr:hypothetical protein [Methylophilaceae bacterium]
MEERDTFAEDMAKELDATILMLAERQADYVERLGEERVAELEEYQHLRLSGDLPMREVEEFERSLSSHDRAWVTIFHRLNRARAQRVLLGRVCMKEIIDGKLPSLDDD